MSWDWFMSFFKKPRKAATPVRPAPAPAPLPSPPTPAPPPPVVSPPPTPTPAPAPTPAPPVVQSALTAPDGTPLGSLLFSEDWSKLDLWDPLAKTGRWSTTGWPNELVGNGWNNVGQASGQSYPSQKCWYLNHKWAPGQAYRPWKLGAGYVDLVADAMPADIAAACGNMPILSAMLNTFPTFSFDLGYVEFDWQLVLKGNPPFGGIWPASWLEVQFAKAYNLAGPEQYGNVSSSKHDLPETDTSEMADPYLKINTATFHIESPADTRKSTPFEKTYTLGDARDRHKYGTLFTKDAAITFLDGVEVGRSPRAQLPMYLILNMGMGGPWPERNGANPVNMAQAPWIMRNWPVKVWSLA